jgi:RecJ-like exonuclease
VRDREAAERAKRWQEQMAREAEDNKYLKTCAKCGGKGTYSVTSTSTTTVDDGYANSYTQYDIYGNSRQAYQFGVKKTRKVTTTGQVSFGCPYCRGTGKVAR